jgi:hypothetical protein
MRSGGADTHHGEAPTPQWVAGYLGFGRDLAKVLR